jgi:EF-P beta-lysylation protein EpmB
VQSESIDRDADSDGLEEAAWSHSLRRAIRSRRDLLERLQLSWMVDQLAEGAQQQFSTLVTEEFLSRMEPGNPNDPLLLQVLAQGQELDPAPGFGPDPVGELAVSTEGVIRKYEGRALVVTTGACAIHCRYCFRRHYPYEDGPKSLDQWQSVLDRLAEDHSIDELILSGGDPLMLPDARWEELFVRIAKIESIRRVRFHTRLPILIPARITQRLTKLIAESQRPTYVVLHSNHANEWDQGVAEAIGRLRRGGAVLLHQAVLLRGVNDRVEAMVDLHRRLIELGVLPYYLHQLDPVAGAAHFAVDPKVGLQLMAALRSQLPGYAVPRYVVELAGELSKVPIDEAWVERRNHLPPR